MEPIEQAVTALTTDVKSFIDKHTTDATETKQKLGETSERLSQIEQKLSRSSVGSGDGDHETKSLGQLVTENEQCKTFLREGHRSSGRIPVGSFFKSTIVNIGSDFALPTRVPTISAAYLPLRVRDLLTTQVATSNIVQFVREDTADNQAQPQGWRSSPVAYEGAIKGESSLTFKLVDEPITTLAHWIAASRQVLDDSTALSSFLNGRMLYFLKLAEEDELLNGTGTGGELTGLVTASVPFAASPMPTGTAARLDAVRLAIGQCEAAGFTATGVVVNPTDWAEINTTKSSGSGEYLFGDPNNSGPQSAWGRPVVVSSKMAAGTFLVGDFTSAGAELWDRMQAVIEISREHADFFTRNLVAILCEERLALTVYQSAAFVTGSY